MNTSTFEERKNVNNAILCYEENKKGNNFMFHDEGKK